MQEREREKSCMRRRTRRPWQKILWAPRMPKREEGEREERDERAPFYSWDPGRALLSTAAASRCKGGKKRSRHKRRGEALQACNGWGEGGKRRTGRERSLLSTANRGAARRSDGKRGLARRARRKGFVFRGQKGLALFFMASPTWRRGRGSDGRWRPAPGRKCNDA